MSLQSGGQQAPASKKPPASKNPPVQRTLRSSDPVYDWVHVIDERVSAGYDLPRMRTVQSRVEVMLTPNRPHHTHIISYRRAGLPPDVRELPTPGEDGAPIPKDVVPGPADLWRYYGIGMTWVPGLQDTTGRTPLTTSERRRELCDMFFVRNGTNEEDFMAGIKR